jgi:hypothetical protein
VENLFGYVKKALQDFEFPPRLKSKYKPQMLAFEVSKKMFEVDKYTIQGFYKKTLSNMLNFWFRFDREQLLRKYYS